MIAQFGIRLSEQEKFLPLVLQCLDGIVGTTWLNANTFGVPTLSVCRTDGAGRIICIMDVGLQIKYHSSHVNFFSDKG